MDESKKWFITFGAGSDNYIVAGNRLCNQIYKLEIFDKIIFYTDTDLQKDDEFWGKNKEFIENNKRGYGYWLWKPYIIKKTLAMMNEGDILCYLDSGCEASNRKKGNLINALKCVKDDLIIYSSTTNIESQWTKRDLFEYLNMNTNQYLNSAQCQAGALLIYKNNKVTNIIDEWYSIGCNYNLINDSPSLLKNTDIFKEHRHDQSILSLLLKKNNIQSRHDISNCIEYIRNRTGIPRCI